MNCLCEITPNCEECGRWSVLRQQQYGIHPVTVDKCMCFVCTDIRQIYEIEHIDLLYVVGFHSYTVRSRERWNVIRLNPQRRISKRDISILQLYNQKLFLKTCIIKVPIKIMLIRDVLYQLSLPREIVMETIKVMFL